MVRIGWFNSISKKVKSAVKKTKSIGKKIVSSARARSPTLLKRIAKSNLKTGQKILGGISKLRKQNVQIRSTPINQRKLTTGTAGAGMIGLGKSFGIGKTASLLRKSTSTALKYAGKTSRKAIKTVTRYPKTAISAGLLGYAAAPNVPDTPISSSGATRQAKGSFLQSVIQSGKSIAGGDGIMPSLAQTFQQQDTNPVHSWSTGTAEFSRFADGSIAVNRKDGTVKVYRPYKSLVFGKKVEISKFVKLAKRYHRYAKELASIYKNISLTKKRR